MIQKSNGLPAFQTLIAHSIDQTKKEAVWIDTGNESSTYALASQGSESLMQKVKIGRAFTPYQHYQTVMELEKFINDKTEIVALPNITSLYAEGQMRQDEAEQLFEETWQKIQEIKQKHDLKIMVSVQEEDRSQIGFKVRMNSDNKIKIENNSEGINYDSNSFETFFYRKNGFVQTTMPYWGQKIGKKARKKVEN